MQRPGGSPFTERTPRVVAARRLLRRRHADVQRRFLVEGPQAVTEALRSGAVIELLGTSAGMERVDIPSGTRVVKITESALAALSDTVRPQGIIAVCGYVDVPLSRVFARRPRLLAVLAEVRDPGNAGTVLRTADAAGADAVAFTDASVDPYNGKCVRATAGSLFHLDVVRGGQPLAVVAAAQAAGLAVYAATGRGEVDLDELSEARKLACPTAWLFGGEAHGLAPELLAAADARVRVPIHGRAESLNLAAAAAVCLYASARHQRREGAAS